MKSKLNWKPCILSRNPTMEYIRNRKKKCRTLTMVFRILDLETDLSLSTSCVAMR